MGESILIEHWIQSVQRLQGENSDWKRMLKRYSEFSISVRGTSKRGTEERGTGYGGYGRGYGDGSKRLGGVRKRGTEMGQNG